MSYIDKLLRLIESNPELKTGLHGVTIRHDDWCQIFLGGPCNCNPEVEADDGPQKH